MKVKKEIPFIEAIQRFASVKKDNFKQKKDNLLLSLKSKKTKYKRLSLSPIRYPGGKSLAVGHIIENLPNVKKIISPFFGGGSIEIACYQKLGIEIIASDIFKPLVKYWQQQIKYPKRLSKELSKLKPTKENYIFTKGELKEYWEGKKKLTDMEIATYYFFNHNLSYGPSFLGWASSVYMSETKYSKMLEKVANFNGTGIKISCCSFEKMLEKYPNDFFYCDPPYFLKDDCDNSKMFAGIYPQRNFPIHHKGFDHKKLNKLLTNHKGGFILSYNNCKKSKEWYKDYIIKYPEWQYTMGQGETRISHNRKNKTYIKQSHEILIYSKPQLG